MTRAPWAGVADTYDPAYLRLFDATLSAGVAAAEDMPDADLERLSAYTGIVGIVAQHVLSTRRGAPEHETR
jgi:hypothetical protein